MEIKKIDENTIEVTKREQVVDRKIYNISDLIAQKENLLQSKEDFNKRTDKEIRDIEELLQKANK